MYEEILQRLAAQGAEWIQLDEPILALDLDAAMAARPSPTAIRPLRAAAPGVKLLLATYFGELRDNVALATASRWMRCMSISPERAGELDAILAQLPGGDDPFARRRRWPQHLEE